MIDALRYDDPKLSQLRVKHVDGLRVLLHWKTAYREAVPPGYMGVSVSKCSPGETSISFPTTWLHARFYEFEQPKPKGPVEIDPPSIILAIRNVARDLFELEKAEAKPAVASQLGLSESDLDAALKSVGTTYQKEIQALRVQLAKHALSKTDDSIAEIGRRLGFGEAGNFTRFFKSKAGVTPREFRISHK